MQYETEMKICVVDLICVSMSCLFGCLGDRPIDWVTRPCTWHEWEHDILPVSATSCLQVLNMNFCSDIDHYHSLFALLIFTFFWNYSSNWMITFILKTLLMLMPENKSSFVNFYYLIKLFLYSLIILVLSSDLYTVCKCACVYQRANLPETRLKTLILGQKKNHKRTLYGRYAHRLYVIDCFGRKLIFNCLLVM